MKNIYKTAWIVVAAIVIPYLAAYGAIDRSYAFAEYLYHGMPVEVAECSMFASEHLLEVTE